MAKKITKDEIFDKGLFDSIISDANKTIDVFDKLDKEILSFIDSVKKSMANLDVATKDGIKDLITLSKSLNAVALKTLEIEKQKILLEKETIKNQNRLVTSKKEQLSAEQSLQRQREKGIAQMEKEARKVAEAERPYNKMSGTLNKLIKDYRDLVLVGQENTNVALNMKKQIDSLDATLKKVDATTGRHQRNVGNYSSAYNGLGNSINQLTREMPAFANSMQTGFMAISNNLPIFFDEIEKIKQANVELKASGEPTKSVMKQIAGSIFSVGTALSVGVTLLTVYGAKLVDWIFTNTKAEESIKRRREQEKLANEETKKAREYIGRESTEFVGLIMQLKSTNKNSKERIDLIKKINDDYGITLNNIKNEAKFQESLNLVVKDYIETIKARYKIERNQEYINKNLQKQEEIKIDLQQKRNKLLAAEIAYEVAKKQFGQDAENSNAKQILDEQIKSIQDLENALASAEERLLYYGYSTLNLTETAGKFTKETKESTKALEDYTIQVKELQNARIEDAKQRRIAELELKYSTDLSAIKADGIKANELRIELEKQYLSDLKDLQVEFDKIRNEENDKKIKFINDQHLLDIENQIQAKEIEMQTELNNADSEKEKYNIRKVYGDELRALKIKQLEEQKRIELQNYELTEKEKLSIQEKYDLEILKLKEGTIQEGEDLDKKALEKEKKRLEEMRNFRRQIFNELLDELKRQSEARESQYDKDIQTQKDFQSQLQAQANAGVITAQQSIAQSIKAEEKATEAKKKEAKKQDRLDKIKMYTQMVNNFLDQKNTPAEAGTKAFAGVGIIEGISKFFKGFVKGTKWKLGDEDKPFMSGVDGHIVRVDSSEAIINGGLMNKAEKAGIKSTEQLVNSAVMYQNYNPQMMRMNDDRQGFNSIGAMMSIEPITQRLESLEQTIKNKVEFSMHPYLVNGIVKGVETHEKSKNLTRKNIIKS
jgi:hypothetical protein